jgi:hypothetical protein
VRPGFDWATKYTVTPDCIGMENSQSYLPKPQSEIVLDADVMHQMEKVVTEDKCKFMNFDSIPFLLKKRSKTCQVCHYEMRKPKWKGSDSSPQLYQANGDDVTDFSWTCPTKASC